MTSLFLADLEDCTVEQIKKHLASDYSNTNSEKENITKKLEQYDILIAYESVGDYGCDSASYFLLQDKLAKDYFEIYGSHCSCYGFEGQFDLEEVTLDFLKSEKHFIYTGGYDSKADNNVLLMESFIKEL